MLKRLLAAAALALGACAPSGPRLEAIAGYPLDVASGHESTEPVDMDPGVSWDGKGSLRVHAADARVVPLVFSGDLDLDDTVLIFQAKLRTRDVRGIAYLEMRVGFPNTGVYYARGLREPLSGSNGWRSQTVRFRLRPGENPDDVALNLVLTGGGTVWVDDVRLFRYVGG